MADRVILLVEDNYDDKLLTMRALKKNNVDSKVVIVSDGAEALEYLMGVGAYTGRVLPDVVLLDLKLPKIDGIEVLRRLRQLKSFRLSF
jgi:two-component system response regulator